MRLLAMSHPLAFHAHLACATRYDLHRGIEIIAVEIRHFDFGDLFELLSGQPSYLFLEGVAAAGLKTQCLLDQYRRRRSLGDKGETLVAENRDDYRGGQPLFHLLGLCIELLAELHDVQAMLPERRSHRRGRVGWARAALR